MKIEAQKKMTAEILFVTDQIRTFSPATYSVLTETPLFLSIEAPEISVTDFQQYLESITRQLEQIMSHGNPDELK